MVKKYTVSVSDELGEKIDRWKGEISPSATFQAAMEKAIEEKESFNSRLKEVETMDQIIERLRAEKMAYEVSFHSKGKEAGLEWAKAANYQNLRYAMEKIKPGANAPQLYNDKVLGAYFKNYFESEAATMLFATSGYGHGEIMYMLTKDGNQWLDGWCNAVKAFWKEVSDKL